MAFQGDSIYWVEVGKIVANPFQPRKEFNESKLKELAESIRMYGILQPLTVTRNEIQSDNGAFYTEYELIAGERRLRASRIAGLEQVPVIIRSGEDTEQEKLELAIIENLQREDLNAVDRAVAFKQLAEVFKMSHSQVAKKVGRSRMYVSNSIRLLGLPECILNSVSLGDISEGHARTLLMLKERPEEQDVVYREILMKKLSVREVERIARKIATDKVRKKQWVGTDAHLIEIEKEFTDTLGTRVQIAKTDFGGKVTIDYFSEGDLQKLLAIITSQGKLTEKYEAERASWDQDSEQQTVIQEMSPEASVLAKITTATPLEVVAEPEVSIAQQSSQEEDVSTHLNTDEVSSIVEIPDSISEIKPVEESAQPLVSEEIADTDDATPEQSASAPTDVQKDEFDFINNEDTEEDKKEGVVTPWQAKDSTTEDAPAETPSEILDTVEQETSSTEELAESALEKLSEAVADKNISQTVDKDGDDDLYSMKNFSL